MRIARLFFMLLLALCVHGCLGTSYQVVAFANPNPFLGAHRFAVAPVRFDGAVAMGEPIEQYMAWLGPETDAEFQELVPQMTPMIQARLAANTGFEVSLANGPPPEGTFVVQVQFRTLTFGSMVSQGMTGSRPISTLARASFDLRIYTAAGQLLDDVIIQMPEMAVGSRRGHPNIGRMLHIMIVEIAGRVGHYLNGRVHPR